MSEDPNDRAARLAGRWGEDSGDEEVTTRGDEAEAAGAGGGETGAGDESEAAGSGQESGVRDGAGRESGDAGGGVDSTESGESGEADRGEDRALTTREMQSQMLYLPPEFHKEVDLTFEELNLRFRRERNRKLEKNKDFYAGLLRLGLDRLGDVGERELDEIEELLDL